MINKGGSMTDITEKLCDQIMAMNIGIVIGYHDDDFVKNQFSVKIGNAERLFKVSTLHEVQNLYYAITKKELIV